MKPRSDIRSNRLNRLLRSGPWAVTKKCSHLERTRKTCSKLLKLSMISHLSIACRTEADSISQVTPRSTLKMYGWRGRKALISTLKLEAKRKRTSTFKHSIVILTNLTLIVLGRTTLSWEVAHAQPKGLTNLVFCMMLKNTKISCILLAGTPQNNGKYPQPSYHNRVPLKMNSREMINLRK